MTASPALLDLNTGLPISSSPYQRQPGFESTTTTTPGRVDTTQQTTQQRTEQQQITSQNILNTTPGALQALEELIRQLSDRPAVSEAELDAKAPNATAFYTPTGWIYTDPLTGRNLGPQEVIQFNKQRTAERQKLKEQAGVIKGGTESQKVTEGQRQQEIGRTREQQGKYSKEVAFSDAQFLIDKAITDALEQAMPGIVAASEGAGTSKGTFRGLALEQAATKGGVEGGALGAQLSVQYGQIYNQLEAMLVEMTKQDPNSPAAMLLQALQASKGMVQSGSTFSSTSGNQTAQVQSQTQVGPTQQRADTVRSYDIAGQTPGAMSGIPNVLSSTPTPNAPVTSPSQTPIGGLYIFSMGDNPQQESDTFDTDQSYEDIIGMEEE